MLSLVEFADAQESQDKVLLESGLSRIYQHYTEHDSGTITAFRSRLSCGSGEEISLQENRKRNVELKRELLRKGYGLTKIAGSYIENYKSDSAVKVSEESFFVVDIKDSGKLKSVLMELGEQFEQDSITFAKKGKEYNLISTNKCESGFPGGGEIGVAIKLGAPKFGENDDVNEFFSSIKSRNFAFKKILEEDVSIEGKYPTEIRSLLNHDAMLLNKEFPGINVPLV